MIICWSAKGGSGTTVVAASLALLLSRSRSTLLIDLAGDAPAALGLPEPSAPGVADWLVSPTADAAALRRLAIPANDSLELLPRGTPQMLGTLPGERWSALVDAATALCDHPTFEGSVVVDAGVGRPPEALVDGSTSLLVTRSCYLSLRRAVALDAHPTGVVLVLEPGRALGAADIERAVGAPVVATVPYDPAVARAVDSGLLAARLPRTLAHPLRSAT